MHSHALLSRPDPQPAGTVRRFARRADNIVAAWWQARPRPVTPWVSPETYPFDADRVPGESYRDYLFRKGVGSWAA
jgi:hypothetical protein